MVNDLSCQKFEFDTFLNYKDFQSNNADQFRISDSFYLNYHREEDKNLTKKAQKIKNILGDLILKVDE
jgi:hypothetical protein